MESQPVVIGLILLSQFFTGTTRPWPLEAYTVTLLIVALHWWALLVERLRQRGIPHQRVQLLRIVGLFVACVVVFLTHLALLTNVLTAIIMLMLVTWFWKRGIDKARVGLSDENLVPTFRIGFLVLLFLFFFFLINLAANSYYSPDYTGVFVALGNAFSLFFFSGLLALSFTRIALIRRDNARSSSGSIFDPTRAWLVVLTLVWIILLAVVTGLDTFSFQSIADFFQPLWLLLGILSLFLLQVIYFLLAPFAAFFRSIFVVPLTHTVQVPSHSTKQQPIAPPVIPPEAILIGRIVLLIILLVLFIQVIRLILRRWQAHQHSDDSEKEIRETLPVRSLLQARRHEQRRTQQEHQPELELLPPNSARARYRELLQELAWNKETLQRHANETPTEYQARLLTQLPTQQPSARAIEAEQAEQHDDAATLASLTSDYTRERYGGKSSEHKNRAYTADWIAHLIKRLVGTSTR